MPTTRRFIVALAIIIGGSLLVGAFLMVPVIPPDVDGEPQEELVFDPFNDLDWWDIAWELGDSREFLTPFNTLAGRGPRWTGTDGYFLAADYMIERLTTMGIEASYWGLHNSVVGYQKGYGNDSRALVFGAHLDSDEYQTGVNQNAGGCAVVMMIAATLAQFRLPIDVYYCFFSGNMVFIDAMKMKRALYGSIEVATQMNNEGVDVIAFYNFDEVMYRNPDGDESRRIVVEHRPESSVGYHKSLYLADLLVSFMKRSGLDIVQPVQKTSTDSDHTSFWMWGFPAVHVTSGHPVPVDMPPSDTASNVRFNRTQCMVLARAASSLAVYLASRGNGRTTQLRLASTLGPGETSLLRAVITHTHRPVVSCANSTTDMILRVYNETHTLLESEIPGNTSFTYETDMDASLGPLTLAVKNTANSTVKIDLLLEIESDVDGDNILDRDEYSWPAPDPPLDWDGDGLGDDLEHDIGTDIFNPDTDLDSLNDGIEVANGLNPLHNDVLEDADSDGLINLREVQIGTNPLSNDTDSDLMPDLWEVTFFTNPLVDDSMDDPDNDTLTNLEEYVHSANPQSGDGDRDGVGDAEEVSRGMNPLNDDTDGDGLRDYLELSEGLDPLVPDYDVDLENDGLDMNPRINEVAVIALMVLIPVAIGSIVFRRRIR